MVVENPENSLEPIATGTVDLFARKDIGLWSAYTFRQIVLTEDSSGLPSIEFSNF